MSVVAKFISFAKAVRLITKVIEAVRKHPEEPRAIYQEGEPTVYLMHEDLYNTLVGFLPSVPEARAVGGVPPAGVHPAAWKAVRDGERIVDALDREPSIFDVGRR